MERQVEDLALLQSNISMQQVCVGVRTDQGVQYVSCPHASQHYKLELRNALIVPFMSLKCTPLV